MQAVPGGPLPELSSRPCVEHPLLPRTGHPDHVAFARRPLDAGKAVLLAHPLPPVITMRES
jgi:hypothetical protein